MAFNEPTEFKGITSYQYDKLGNNLLLGIQDFFSWAFLKIGGFQNISRDPAVSGQYGDHYFDRTRLRMCDDPNYDEGQVWEGFRNDWVWETGCAYDGVEPIHVSGVWVDDYFYGQDPSDATIYSHYVDYPNGRVIFDYPLDSDREVELNFSHRTVGVTLASEKFVQELMYDSYDMKNLNDYLSAASGSRTQLGERKLQLPLVALELVQSRERQGYQLGGGEIAYNDVLFHVFADNQFEKNNIRDIVLSQSEKVFYLINRSYMKANNRHVDESIPSDGHKFPHQLNELGYPVPSALMYPDLVKPTGEGGFRLTTARFDRVTCTDMEPVNSWLHRATVRATFSVITGAGDSNIGDI